MVLASEIGHAGPIVKVEYQSGGNYANASFGEFEMRLCHTPLSTLTNNFQNNYGGRTPVLVAAANPLLITAVSEAWFGFNCSPVFDYNRQDNLIVEVRWRNTQLSAEVDCWCFDAGSNRGLLYKDYNATEGALGTKINRLRLTLNDVAVSPTTLGRVKGLYR